MCVSYYRATFFNPYLCLDDDSILALRVLSPSSLSLSLSLWERENEVGE